MTTCILKRCPRASYGRLRDGANKYRRDLCRYHFWHTMKFYNKGGEPQVFIVEIWGS